MLTLKTLTSTCPCCNKLRSAHSKTEKARCSAWTKLNMAPGKKSKTKRVTQANADGFTRLIHHIENN